MSLRAVMLALGVVLVACMPAPRISTMLRPAYLEGVRPLQLEQAKTSEETLAIFYEHGWEHTTTQFLNVCTAESVNIEKHYWMTAAHCVADIGPEGRFIQGVPVVLVDVQTDVDLAVIEVPGLAASFEFPLVLAGPSWQEDIIMAGHPFGYPDIFVTRGYVANPKASVDGTPFMVFDMAGAPGNSGSPVINLRGGMISLLQIGWGRTFGPVCGGTTTANLNRFAHYFAHVV